MGTLEDDEKIDIVIRKHGHRHNSKSKEKIRTLSDIDPFGLLFSIGRSWFCIWSVNLAGRVNAKYPASPVMWAAKTPMGCRCFPRDKVMQFCFITGSEQYYCSIMFHKVNYVIISHQVAYTEYNIVPLCTRWPCPSHHFWYVFPSFLYIRLGCKPVRDHHSLFIKAKIYAISSDTHQLRYTPLHQFTIKKL